MVRKIREPEEPAETQVQTTSQVAAPKPDPGGLAEYEINGATYQLTADEAKARGAKSVSPKNKALTPQNK